MDLDGFCMVFAWFFLGFDLVAFGGFCFQTDSWTLMKFFQRSSGLAPQQRSCYCKPGR